MLLQILLEGWDPPRLSRPSPFLEVFNLIDALRRPRNKRPRHMSPQRSHIERRCPIVAGLFILNERARQVVKSEPPRSSWLRKPSACKDQGTGFRSKPLQYLYLVRTHPATRHLLLLYISPKGTQRMNKLKHPKALRTLLSSPNHWPTSSSSSTTDLGMPRLSAAAAFHQELHRLQVPGLLGLGSVPVRSQLNFRFGARNWWNMVERIGGHEGGGKMGRTRTPSEGGLPEGGRVPTWEACLPEKNTGWVGWVWMVWGSHACSLILRFCF